MFTTVLHEKSETRSRFSSCHPITAKSHRCQIMFVTSLLISHILMPTKHLLTIIRLNSPQKDRTQRYQDLEPPFSFAIKCNTEILNYAMPPFAGVLRNLYDISDYEDLKLTKTELENYALLVMKLGIDKDGNWLMDYQS